MKELLEQIQDLRKVQAEEFNKAYEELVKQYQCRLIGQIIVKDGKLEIEYFIAPIS